MKLTINMITRTVLYSTLLFSTKFTRQFSNIYFWVTRGRLPSLLLFPKTYLLSATSLLDSPLCLFRDLSHTMLLFNYLQYFINKWTYMSFLLLPNPHILSLFVIYSSNHAFIKIILLTISLFYFSYTPY